ncbi:alpha/beta hydrolase [Pullulanibacillus sp. KACC 23026]|uniref:alpha/beta hydrolase n=1 Tax=Pullulanibacillus sp. KACC 23026 TaxID=3028315 RepID=UPI0023B1E1D1|nr:alpha/beta hydrolase [Pullulanibacillus sp. KACC 23026]WEG12469.1 alpha/beta hydrolase [Pullulanibacillus sp. KACC 23026]
MGKLQNQVNRLTPEVTIKKTIFASVMDNGFWERWIAHGIDQEFILKNRGKMTNLENWVEKLQEKALEHSLVAKKLQDSGDSLQSELNYRIAALYYNLIQWVYPEPSGDKAKWYGLCLEQFSLADRVSMDKITHHSLMLDGKKYEGRVRIPGTTPKGVVIIVTPTDSTKEEMFTYESDFARSGMAVVSFDGTGQGETLIINGHKADQASWYKLVRELVDFVHNLFPKLSINLFGCSSGGSWAIEASRHPLVAKTVAVSPAPRHLINISLPDYFRERLHNMLADFDAGSLPVLDDVTEINNMLIIHGGKDLMVKGDDLYELYSRFSPEKRFIVYEEEGHCCNFKLPEIRRRASNWFKGEDINDI